MSTDNDGHWELIHRITDEDPDSRLFYQVAAPEYDLFELQVAVEDQSGSSNDLQMRAADATSGYWYEYLDDATLSKATSTSEFILTSLRANRVGSGSVQLGQNRFIDEPSNAVLNISGGPMMSGSTGGGNRSLLRGFCFDVQGDFGKLDVYSEGNMTGSVALFGTNIGVHDDEEES